MKVALLISGGVDSSVTLALLKEKGYEIVPYYIKVWLQDEFTSLGNCPWEEDIGYAEKVCTQFGLKLNIISLQKAYWDRVVKTAIAEIKKGRTPNPDFLCNSKIKFGEMLKHLSNDFSYIASGHYAKIKRTTEGIQLMLSPDKIKDQTYFLAGLSPRQLSHCLFPLGDFNKNEVRELAKKFKLVNQTKKDSQGVCFLGKIHFQDFIKFHLGTHQGTIIDEHSGKILGKHQGYWFYTIGQRQGLGLGNGPWYVVRKNIKNNQIYVSPQSDTLKKKFQHFIVKDINLLKEFNPTKKILVKIRHGEKFHLCQVKPSTNHYEVFLSVADPGIAPGQYAVFYQGEVCVASGVIETVLS